MIIILCCRALKRRCCATGYWRLTTRWEADVGFRALTRRPQRETRHDATPVHVRVVTRPRSHINHWRVVGDVSSMSLEMERVASRRCKTVSFQIHAHAQRLWHKYIIVTKSCAEFQNCKAQNLRSCKSFHHHVIRNARSFSRIVKTT